jgi:hypothetical protein
MDVRVYDNYFSILIEAEQADKPFPSDTEFNNAWRFTSTSSIHPHGVALRH